MPSSGSVQAMVTSPKYSLSRHTRMARLTRAMAIRPNRMSTGKKGSRFLSTPALRSTK